MHACVFLLSELLGVVTPDRSMLFSQDHKLLPVESRCVGGAEMSQGQVAE